MPQQLNRVAPLLEQMSQQPLAISQTAAALFQQSIEYVVSDAKAMATAFATTKEAKAAANDNEFWGNPNDPDDYLHYYRPYNVKDGVLQIPVMGVLLDRFPWQLGRWATGYKYIEMAIKRGLEDVAVTAIALIFDSPGGEVSGCFELAEKVAAATKPTRAFVANHAYSAAYALASSCDVITVTKSGGVGSIGVVTSHVSYADALDKAGIKVTFIFAGKHKVDGNPYENLPDAVKARIQKRIDKIYGIFTSTVAQNRGMDEKDVRATEALTYDAEEAIENGLADRIGALEEEMVIFTEEAGDTGDEYMTVQTGNVTGQKPENSGNGVDQATYERGLADAKAEGFAAGQKAAMDRISAIMNCDEAKDKQAAATKFALKTSMSLDEAKALLTDMPSEKAETKQAEDEGKAKTAGAKTSARNHFAEAMNNSDNPNLTAVEGGDDEGDDTDKAVNSILGAYASVAGKPRKTA